ncbi:hypothetical protein KIN20_022862 [Parelaphostrongylus tenuis]|uniref:Uncharacterized protein n=1 Tax=Parelaphostrongylus tenuis TaxID=148309 RepID=A0AAD5N9I8_PARTN|nr:hypothetical protein KIN20_022862 [Parelaphostrongylus tenuis]
MSDAESFLRYFSDITPQGQQMLDLECSLLLECKASGEIFRTIMSYISHRRTFCRENIKNEQNAKDEMEDNSVLDSQKTNSGRGPENSASLPAERQDSLKCRGSRKGKARGKRRNRQKKD